MKKNIYILPILLLFFSSCSDELLKSNESDLSQNNVTVRQKSGGDGIYDVLGYGYNATGLYMNSYSSTFPVIDMSKFKAAQPQNIEIDLSSSTEGTYSSGADAENYANGLTASLDVECKWPLFSAQVTGTYSLTKTSSSKYSYASYNMLLRQKRISINSSISNLSNYLSDQFILDLNNQSADYIVSNYGTHVLLEVQLGAKLELSYQTTTSSTTKKEAATAGLIINANSMFNANANVSVNTSLDVTNTNESIKYKTFGGAVNQALVGTLPLSGSPSPINISGWQSSCNTTNMVLINVAPKKMIYIYDLITDPTKKAAIKTAVENYISGNTIQYGIDIIQLKQTINNKVRYQYSTIVPSSYEGWTNYGTISYVYPINTFRTGTVPLYQFYRRILYNGEYVNSYILTTNSNYGDGFTLVRTEGNVYQSAIDNSVIPLYEFFNSSTLQYTYSTNKLAFGNGNYYSTGPDGFFLKGIVCYVPK